MAQGAKRFPWCSTAYEFTDANPEHSVGMHFAPGGSGTRGIA